MIAAPAAAQTRFACNAPHEKPARFLHRTSGSTMIVSGTMTPQSAIASPTHHSMAVTRIEARELGAADAKSKRLEAWLRLETRDAPANAVNVRLFARLGEKIEYDEVLLGTLEFGNPLAFSMERDPKGLKLTVGGKSTVVAGSLPDKIEVELACSGGYFHFGALMLGAPTPTPAP